MTHREKATGFVRNKHPLLCLRDERCSSENLLRGVSPCLDFIGVRSLSGDRRRLGGEASSAGITLSDLTDYLEALDILSEAQDVMEASGLNESALYADILYTLAQTKIKARIHQNFPAFYVKSRFWRFKRRIN